MKLFRTLLVLVLSFLIMWSPIFISIFLILARNFLAYLNISSTMFFWMVTFTMTTSALNPILYSVCQFKSSWRRLCCSCEVAPCGRGWTQGIHSLLSSLSHQIEDLNIKHTAHSHVWLILINDTQYTSHVRYNICLLIKLLSRWISLIF